VTNYRQFKSFCDRPDGFGRSAREDAAMNITSPLFKGATEIAALPSESLTSLVHRVSDIPSLFTDAPDGGLGIIMSGLAGAAAALAVAIALTVYFHGGYRTARELVKHGIAATIALALVAFVISDMRHAALAYLGLNPAKPMVEFEIRLPTAQLSAMSETQIELHTDRNQKLAQVEGAVDAAGQSVLRGVVTLDYRTTDRVVVLTMPGRIQCEFKLRLPAEPSRSGQFGQFSPWHLADRVALPDAAGPLDTSAHDAFAIRYRVI
jgi:hypothetical protein